SGVLGHSHYLEVESSFYPVRVQRASQSEPLTLLFVQCPVLFQVDMPVETKLDSSMFANLQKVEQLIKENGFEITKLPAPDLYRLKGTLLNLKLLRKQLTPYLHQDLLHQSCYPSGLSNGYSSASLSPVYRTELGRSAAKSSSENSLHFVNGVRPWRGSPMVDGATSFVDASPASFKRQPISTAYGDAGSPRNYPNLRDDPYQSRPPTRQRQESTVVERDILDYALRYKQDIFNDIHTNYGTKMSLKDDEDITTVTFLGRNCRRATAMLQALIEDIRPHLRTQEINLKKYSSREQGQIRDRINLYKDLGVLIKHDSNIIKLVGSSTRSFQVKQMLLGIEGDWSTSTQRGRKLERSSLLRRSSSLPKQHKFSTVRETDQRHSPVPDYKGGAAKVYSPSNYQEEPQTRKSPQTGSPDKQTRRRRSMSLDSSKSRETREQPKQSKQLMASGGELMLPSSVEKKKSPIAQAFTM
ncbi:hypothetical protein NFI96_015867, partial [Prochilodus magdalenae]